MTIVRQSKPEKDNKYFNTKSNGGYSTCVKGKPTQSGLDVLSNCVGCANACFNETIGAGKEVYDLNCNAENFIERAIARGLSVVQEPCIGGIMVWQKGATLSGKDGAGHVAYVYEKFDKDTIGTSESGWNSTAFWNAKRKRGNGNWGQNSNYKYRGCIVNPKLGTGDNPKPVEPISPIEETFKVGDKVVPTRLVDYNGTPLVRYDKEYTIIEPPIGDRAVLGARNQVWAAMNTKDIKKVN